MMVLVMKLTAFSWSCYDGLRPEKNLSAYQKKFALQKMPKLVDFLGCVFFFPCFLIGPAFQFQDYEDFIEKRVRIFF